MLHRHQIPDWVFDPSDPQQELTQAECELAYQFASLQPDLSEESTRSLCALAKRLMLMTRYGSTRLPISGDTAELLSKAPLLIGTGAETKPWIIDDGFLYPHRSFTYEVEIAAEIKNRTSQNVQSWSNTDDQRLSDVIDRPALLPNGEAIALSDEQQEAIRLAVSRPFCVVSGGPGTGKTSIIVSLLRMFARQGVEVHAMRLAAPTGKAASRMSESIRQQLERVEDPSEEDRSLLAEMPTAETIHRLLGYSAQYRTFSRDERRRLAAEVVIIDEASMIDLSLMAKLLRAIPQSASVILVGDSQQLPSVDAGAVLRDLVPADGQNGDHAAFLRKSFRMRLDDPSGREVLSRANALNRGDIDAFRDGILDTFAFEGGGVSVHSAGDTQEMIGSFADIWFERRFSRSHIRALSGRVYRLERGEFSDEDAQRIRDLLDFYNDGRVLCATRVRRTGSGALNDMFHRRMVETTTLEGDPRFVAGEPILMLKNDYDRSLFNGDHGVVLLARTDEDPSPHPMAVFPAENGFRAHHLGALGNRITLAYAMTVHKSQGSEFDDVVVILPDYDLPILTRELLYTATTRAKRSVSILGKWEIIETTIARRVTRHSGLRDRITSPKHP